MTVIALVLTDLSLAAAIGAHYVYLFRAATLGTECDKPAVRGPGRVFVASNAGQLGIATAIDVDGVNLEPATLHAGIGDPIPFWGPPGGDIVTAGRCQAPDIAAIGIHHKDLWLAQTIGDKGDLFAVRRPSRRDLDGWAYGQADQV